MLSLFTEAKVIFPIKTLGQLPLLLKGFRKEKGLTQAAMAERLGITQQSYAYFEANPTTATLERLFMVLRLLDVEIALDQPLLAGSKAAEPVAGSYGQATVKTKRPAPAAVKQKESW